MSTVCCCQKCCTKKLIENGMDRCDAFGLHSKNGSLCKDSKPQKIRSQRKTCCYSDLGEPKANTECGKKRQLRACRTDQKCFQQDVKERIQITRCVYRLVLTKHLFFDGCGSNDKPQSVGCVHTPPEQGKQTSTCSGPNFVTSYYLVLLRYPSRDLWCAPARHSPGDGKPECRIRYRALRDPRRRHRSDFFRGESTSWFCCCCCC